MDDPILLPGQGLNDRVAGGVRARPEPLWFPLKGICYFCTHPKLWCYVICPLVGGIVATILSLWFVFGVALEPLEQFLETYWSEFLAWLTAVLVCLVLVVILVFAVLQLLMATAMEKVFIYTMKQKGVWTGEHGVCNLKDELLWVVFSLVVNLLILPLNFIPVVGTCVYCAAAGAFVAWEYHELYFDMCGIPRRQQRSIVYSAKLEYMRFGLVAQLMQLIPVFGLFAFVTNAVGAALWAAELEGRELRPTTSKINAVSALQAAPMKIDGV